MTPSDASEARAQILAKIGSAGSETDVAAAYSAIERNYHRHGELDAMERLELLEHRLQEYDALVYRSEPAGITAAIARTLSGRGKQRIAIPPGLNPAWLPSGFSFLPGEDLPLDDLDQVDGVLSGCTVAIAMTGTLVLQNAPMQGARRLSLIPDYHLCIVNASQIVETVPEAMALLDPFSVLPTTFVSGPSATADIEMTRIKGVHGPRFLDVILIV